MLSLEGKQLGNYDVIKRIRVGGMGAVYEGRQRTAFDRRVAIKVILGDYADDPDMRRRFAREARTIARLHHPHILQLIEFGADGNILYLVMPFIEGGTLTSYLRRHLPDLAEVEALYTQLLDAVEYAHEEGLIHRDIKSSNVLMESRRSGVPHVYLADFGLVRTMRQYDARQVGKPIPLDQVPGTPHYMAPEQTRGIISPLTDIYALGVLLYQILTGNLPYNNDDDVRVIEMHLYDPIPRPSLVDASIPAELDEVVRTAMAKRPEERYQSVADLRKAFLAALSGPHEPVIEYEAGDEADLMAAKLPRPTTEPQPLPKGLNLPPPAPRRAAPQARPTRELPPEYLNEIQGEARAREQGQPGHSSVRLQPPLTPQTLRNEGIPAALRDLQEREPEKLEKQRESREKPQRLRTTTEDVRLRPPIITEEPGSLQRRPSSYRSRKQQKHLTLPIILCSIVILLLIAMLVISRIFGGGLPGPNSIDNTSATITLNLASKSVSNHYLLTASIHQATPDIGTRTIPARALNDEVTGTKSVSTTGSNTIAAKNAVGKLHITNPGDAPVDIPANTAFKTASGISVHTKDPITVTGKQNNQDGAIDIDASADIAGKAGNIGAGAINTHFNGPNNSVLNITNPAPFSGGEDASTTHIVTQDDIDGAKAALESNLKQQAQQHIRKQLGSNDVLVGQPSYHEDITANPQVNAVGDQVQVTLKITASATAYDRSIAQQMSIQLLQDEATKTLGATYHLQGSIISDDPTQTGGNDDPIFLNTSSHGTWIYTLDEKQSETWLKNIRGATPAVARAYLKQQPGVTDANIHLPEGTDHLPDDVTMIKIVVR